MVQCIIIAGVDCSRDGDFLFLLFHPFKDALDYEGDLLPSKSVERFFCFEVSIYLKPKVKCSVLFFKSFQDLWVVAELASRITEKIQMDSGNRILLYDFEAVVNNPPLHFREPRLKVLGRQCFTGSGFWIFQDRNSFDVYCTPLRVLKEHMSRVTWRRAEGACGKGVNPSVYSKVPFCGLFQNKPQRIERGYSRRKPI